MTQIVITVTFTLAAGILVLYIARRRKRRAH